MTTSYHNGRNPRLLVWLRLSVGGAGVFIGLLLAVPQPILAQTGAAVAVGDATDASDSYKLDVGDKVRVTVFGEMDLSGEYDVDGSGNVRLPLMGQVRAAGLTLYQFEAQVKSALEPDYLKNAKVNVEVINYRPFYILGQVNKPGEYPYVNGMNVLTAVALAGGYTYRASEINVFVRHRGSNEEQALRADQATKVYPGDIIRVRERFF